MKKQINDEDIKKTITALSSINLDDAFSDESIKRFKIRTAFIKKIKEDIGWEEHPYSHLTEMLEDAIKLTLIHFSKGEIKW